MNRALLAKELRALRPVALCLVALSAVGMLYLFATEAPDAQPLDPAKWLLEPRAGAFMVVALFSLLLGAGLLIQESDQGTLHFLDGLPLSRTRIFCAKALAALLVIALVPVLGFVTEVPLGLISRTSLDGPFPWAFAWTVFGLQIVAGAYLTGFAMVVSFLRGWFALVTGLIFLGFLFLRARGVEGLAYFDPHELLAPGIGGGITLPWRHLAAQGGAALVFFFVAWLGFCSLGDRAQFAADRLGRRGVWRVLKTALKFLAPVVWIAAFVILVEGVDTDETDNPSQPVGEAAFARQETERFEFLFRAAQRGDAAKLIAAADEIHEQVAALLHATAPAARIVVDLASPVMPHAAGQTNWTKIRLPVTPDQEFELQRRILAHETAHVLIEQLGGGRLTAHFSAIRSLHEGLATHVEHALYPTPEQQVGHRRAVAGGWSRGRVPFGLLVENDKLARERDPNLAYPLGAELARALIATHGGEAPAQLLRAIGRPGQRTGLEGGELWREAMQAAGLDLERVAAAYESACAEIAVAEREFTASLPRLAAKVALEGDHIVLRPSFAGEPPGRMICAIENEEPISFGPKFLTRRVDGTFAIARAPHAKASIRYLLGWRVKMVELPICEPWAEAEVE